MRFSRVQNLSRVLLSAVTAFMLWNGESSAMLLVGGREAKEVPRQIALVIDDLGNDMKGSQQMLELPVKLTVAVMPFLPTTKQDAEAAYRKGHDVIVHLPMEPLRGKRSWLGPGAIFTDLSDNEIRKRVEAAIDAVPHAIGMNNHMGSRATSDKRVMRIVLQVCKERGLFFLDSRTSYRTVIPKVGEALGVNVLHNNVFLDDVYSRRHVMRQLKSVKKFLQQHDSCVVTGHVGPQGIITAGALKDAIPDLKNKAVFVPLSRMLPPVHQITERNIGKP